MKKKEALLLLRERMEFAKEHYAKETADYIKALEIAIEAISEQLNRWYRPEERLPDPANNPKEDGLLLAVVNGTYKNARFEDAYMFAYFNPDAGWALEEYPDAWDISVKKWMPLPDQEDVE